MDRPGFEAREALQGERKATQEKDSALTRSFELDEPWLLVLLAVRSVPLQVLWVTKAVKVSVI